jgi:hypothetical protein
MTSKHTIILVAIGLLAAHLAPTAKGNIIFQVADLGGGSSQWRLVSSDTTYTVAPNSGSGFFFDQIILPKSAFTFDYSQAFTYTFSNPIGVIENLTSHQSVALDQIIYFKNLDQLQLIGGPLNYSSGDQFQVTDLSVSTIAIPFSDLTGTALNSGYAYYTPGAWHYDSVIEINPVAIPEPSAFVLLGFGAAGIFFSRRLGLARTSCF